MKRVLIVTTSYPDQNEGKAAAGVFVRDFAIALKDKGISVALVAPALHSSETIEDGIRVTRFRVPRLPLSLLNPVNPLDWLSIATTLYKGVYIVDHTCAIERPDFIFAFWALPSGFWAKVSANKYDIPYGIWSLGSDIWTLGRIPGIRGYLRHVLRDAAYRFSDGYQLAEDVQSISGKPCHFLPSSRRFFLDFKRQVSSAPPFRLAFLGRWHTNKGIDLLLEALTCLNRRAWEKVDLIRIHGGGPLEALVHQKVDELASSGRPVEYGGYLDLQGAQALFAWADFVLIPSRIESIPVVFSDAMQAECPVIVTPVGDLPRLVTGLHCGEVAERVHAIEFSKAIKKAICATPGKYCDGVRVAAEQFRVDSSAGLFLKVVDHGE